MFGVYFLPATSRYKPLLTVLGPVVPTTALFTLLNWDEEAILGSKLCFFKADIEFIKDSDGGLFPSRRAFMRELSILEAM
jgi:hypothetical protein